MNTFHFFFGQSINPPRQLILVNALAHNAAMNPRAFRRVRRKRGTERSPLPPQRNVLDGALLWRFTGLDVRDQHRLTRAIGTTTREVLRSLAEIDRSAAVFV